jgi:AbiV
MKDDHEILENARRLSDDAHLLCDAGRYASCVLLQILCIEELGKYYLGKLGITYANKNWHRKKQEAALSLAAGRAVQRLVDERCRNMGWDYWGNDNDAEAFYDWLQREQGIIHACPVDTQEHQIW